MSFDNLNEKQLREVADEFVLDVPENATEDQLRSAVEEVGTVEVALSFPKYAELLADPEVEEILDEADYADEEPAGVISTQTVTKKTTSKKAAVKKAPAKVAAKGRPARRPVETVVPSDHSLVKMTRNNPVYEVRGYRFSRVSPFVMVHHDDIDYLIEVEGGFTMAKPSEVEAFYS